VKLVELGVRGEVVESHAVGEPLVQELDRAAHRPRVFGLRVAFAHTGYAVLIKLA
jgi:hypothetical protein